MFINTIIITMNNKLLKQLLTLTIVLFISFVSNINYNNNNTSVDS